MVEENENPTTPQPDLAGFFEKMMGEVDTKLEKIKAENDKVISDLAAAHEQNSSVLDQLLNWIEGEKTQKEKTARESKKNHLVVPPQDLKVEPAGDSGTQTPPATLPTTSTPTTASSKLRDRIRRLV